MKTQASWQEHTEQPLEALRTNRSRANRGWIRGLWPALFAAPLVATVLWSGIRNGDGSVPLQEPLPVLGTVPDFSLTERSGRTVTRADLTGFVWIANFIFTECSGPCPTLSLRMRSLQEPLKERGERVRLVSFSLDPEHDTPAVLRKYAGRHQADPDFWWFLTCGDESRMHHIVRDGLKQSVVRAAGRGNIVHSTYFLLVDQTGRVRGVYPGTEAATKAAVLRDVARLLAEGGDAA